MLNNFAHVKWFVDHKPPSTDPMSGLEWLIAVILVAGLAGIFYLLHRWWNPSRINRALDKSLGKFEWLVPILVRLSTGFLLLVNAWYGLLYAPNVPVGSSTGPQLLSIAFTILGVLLIVGILPRLVGGTLILLYGVSLGLVEPLPDLLDHMEYIGIGLYLLFRGGGRYCLIPDNFDFGRLKASAKDILRIFVGLNLMELAISEKLIGIGYSNQFLEFHNWNFLSSLLSDREFIILAGVVEFAVGLILVLNLAARITSAVVLILMIITASLLGIDEVYGHLFAIGLVAVIWLDGGKAKPAKTKAKSARSSKRKT